MWVKGNRQILGDYLWRWQKPAAKNDSQQPGPIRQDLFKSCEKGPNAFVVGGNVIRILGQHTAAI
jgi:hypothetical protein